MTEGCRGLVGGCPGVQVEDRRWEMVVGGCSRGSEGVETLCG